MRDEEGVSRARPSREDSLARHHLRLEDHHRVALERRLRHGLPRGAEAQADGVDAPRSGSPGVAGKAARRPLVVGLGDRRERAADADLSSIDLSRG